MLRSLLAWFVLLNYLLLVGAGLRVGRPEIPFSKDRPYVHSVHCQHDNYLRLDCFEGCNGDQTRVLKQLPTESGWHFLAQLKGLDVHCLALGALAATSAPVRWRLATARATLPTPAVRASLAGRPDRPPCCG